MLFVSPLGGNSSRMFYFARFWQDRSGSSCPALCSIPSGSPRGVWVRGLTAMDGQLAHYWPAFSVPGMRWLQH